MPRSVKASGAASGASVKAQIDFAVQLVRSQGQAPGHDADLFALEDLGVILGE